MQAILIVSGIAGLVLSAALFLRGGMLAGSLAVLLAGSCFGHAFYHVPMWPLPITADRLLLAGLVVCYVVSRGTGLTRPKPLQTADWVLLAFFGVLLFSTFTHDWAAKDNQPVSNVLFMYLMPLALYWVIRQSPVTRRQVLWLLGGLTVFGIYLSLTAVAEVKELWSVVYPKYIASADTHSEYFGRGRGPFLNAFVNGIVISVCLCAALTWWPRLGRAGQLLLMLSVPVFLIGAYYTLTRSVWLGAAGGFLLVVGVSLTRRTSYALMGAAMTLGFVFAAANWERIWTFKRDRDISAHEMSESAQLRPILAAVAWNMFRDRPLLGCGFGQYERESIHYLDDRSWGLPLEKARPYVQHNTFLALLTELGIIGMGLFVLLLCVWARDAWRLWRSRQLPLWARQVGLLLLAMLVIYLPNAMFHDVTLTPMVTMLLFTLSGAAVSLLMDHEYDLAAVGAGS